MDENRSDRIKRIEEFLLDPEKTLFETIEEFKGAVDALLPVLQKIDVERLDMLAGEDGYTPERGVDYFTEEDIGAIEQFILQRLPRAGVDYVTIQQTEDFVKSEVAKIPRVKGDKGDRGAAGKDGRDGSPDTGTDIVRKLRALDKNQRLQISDVRGLESRLNAIPAIEDDIDALRKEVEDIKIIIPNAPIESSGGTTGTVTSVSVVTDNGFSGSVANPSTTPAITVSTTVSGMMKGDGTAVSAAVAGTDYVAPGSVTTSGLTMSTARILGRSSASTGDVEEIQVGSGLNLSGGTLSAQASAPEWGDITGTLSDQTDLQNALNAKIEGTIDVGQVAFGTATDTVGGSSNLFWDSSTNRLGINNGTPTHALTVNGDSIFTSTLNVSAGGASILRSSASTTLTVTQAATGNIADFYDGATLAMSILDGGNVKVANPGTSSDSVATLEAAQTFKNKTISADDNTISGIAASSFVLSNGSGNIDGSAAQKAIPSGAVVGTSDTQTLSNKRITRRVSTTNAPGATPSTNVDNVDVQIFTGLATDITSMATNLSGTPTDCQLLEFQFVDNGTPRSITWGSSFADGGMVELPTTTEASVMLRVLLEYQTTASLNKWVCVAVA